MKKILFSILAALMAVPSFAQYSSGGFELDKQSLYYGVRIGMNVSRLTGDTKVAEVQGVNCGSKVGMTLAGVIGLRLSSTTPVFLESGLYVTERGAKDVGYTNLELPLLVKYGIQADKVAFLPYIGPYFAYAISGKTKVDGKTDKVGTFDEKEWMGLSRANMGFKFGCGVEYDMLYLELGYQVGVTNLSKANNATVHSGGFFANFGVNF